MDYMKGDDEGLLIFEDEHDIGSIIDNFDDVLKDPLPSWPVSDPGNQGLLLDLPKEPSVLDHEESWSDVDGSLHKPVYSQCSYENQQDAVKILDSLNTFASQCCNVKRSGKPETSDSNPQLNPVVPVQSCFKTEPLERSSDSSPELLKLLTSHLNPRVSSEPAVLTVHDKLKLLQNVSTDSCCVMPVQSVPVQSQAMQQPLTTQGMSLPVQSLALNSPNIFISPQQTSSVKICSLLPSHVEESKSPVMPLSSNQAAPNQVEIATTQVVSSASRQVPVQQLILHAQVPDSTTAVQGPIQLVIDSTTLPITCNPPANPAPPAKVERHRAHNAIEKKYRTSINEKIIEMKNLLFGADAKIQKSGVLRKAIDHIKYLRSINTRLRQENMSFKMKLQRLGALSCVKPDDCDQMGSVDVIPAPLTPESMADAHSSAGSSSSSPPASPCKSDDSFGENVTMLDRTRIGLCILMFSFFVFDPFNLVLSWHKGFTWQHESQQQSRHHGSGRLLMAETLIPTLQPVPFSITWFIINLLSWLSRSLVIGFLFLKLFVFGEPSLQPDSKAATKFWAFKRQADIFLEKGEYIAASKALRRCLETLGRPLPTSRLDMACSLSWHMFRHLFHRLWITRWLAALALRYVPFPSAGKKDMKLRQESAKQASLVYHQLHQLYLTGHVVGNSWLATIVVLNAVNLAEMAGVSLDEEKVVEMYIDAAIQLRSTLPRRVQFLARYFLGRARRLCRGQSLTLPYSCWWLFTPVGHRFFVSGEWSCKGRQHIWSSSNSNENKPLMAVTQEFCCFLLEQALSSLLLSQKHDTIITQSTCSSEDGNCGSIQAMDWLHTLGECVKNSRKSGINRNIKVFGDITTWPSKETDVLGCWWTAIGKVAACWLLGDTAGAQQHYKVIENIPEELEKNDDPIGKALLMAFKARSRLLANKSSNKENFQELRDCCDRSGGFLKESIAFAALYPPNNLLTLMQLLCCDWLLSSRSEVWEKEMLDGEAPLTDSSNLDGFDKDLKSLQKVVSVLPEALPKVYLYQATFRMMSGASPVQTQRLLQRSILQNRVASDGKMRKDAGIPRSLSAEKDRAGALVLASSHLPESMFSSCFERKGMILDAVESLQKYGEKDRIARCRKLLMGV